MTDDVTECQTCGQADNCGDCDHTPVPLIVRIARTFVREHLGDARQWYGIDRDDCNYFNAETGRGACDDDILDTVRDDIVGDLLDDPAYENIAAESLSDAASEAVHEYVLNERLSA